MMARKYIQFMLNRGIFIFGPPCGLLGILFFSNA